MTIYFHVYVQVLRPGIFSSLGEGGWRMAWVIMTVAVASSCRVRRSSTNSTTN